MKDIFANFVLAILLFVAILYVPILLISLKVENINQSHVAAITTEYVDNWRATGRITYNDYKEMYSRLSNYMEAEVVINHGSYLCGYDGTEYEYYHYYNTQDILDTISPEDNSQGKDYLLRPGDYITMEVTNQSPTFTTRIARIVLPHLGNKSIYFPYGGMVGNYIEK